MGMRLHQEKRSKRWRWLRDEAPAITSIISLADGTLPVRGLPREILLFNMPKLKPHYFLPIAISEGDDCRNTASEIIRIDRCDQREILGRRNQIAACAPQRQPDLLDPFSHPTTCVNQLPMGRASNDGS